MRPSCTTSAALILACRPQRCSARLHRRGIAALDAWRAEYNTTRPHQSLDMASPAGRFRRMLGHASAAMTLDVYADLFEDDLGQVADRLDQAATRAGADMRTAPLSSPATRCRYVCPG